jgi:uncharacterized membrane protein
MIELIGHFHPLLVHLPIGILLIGLLLQWLSGKPNYAGIQPAIKAIFLVGTIAALFSCITGYMLSISDDYDQSLINWHMWFAIGVLLLSAILYTKEVNPNVQVNKTVLSITLLITIMITGHLGGSLTHGSDYLSKPLANLFSNDSNSVSSIKPLPNVQEAMAYNDVVRPILETKCYSCHNANKKKGGLRMDDILLLMKGGKNGKVIDLDLTDSSELLQRLLLPVDNEDHMPPKEKPQPTESQVALIHWWISSRADFTKKVKELPQTDLVRPLLLALQQPVINNEVKPIIPAKPVKKADEKVLAELQKVGITVLPVAQNSNYLSVTIADKKTILKKDIELFEKMKDQLIWLKIEDAVIDDEAAKIIGKLSNLMRLNLSGCKLTGNGWQALHLLQNIEYLTLVGSNAAGSNIASFQNNKHLQSIYLFGSNVKPSDVPILQKLFPKTKIDTGNYQVPTLVTDTTKVLPPKVQAS